MPPGWDREVEVWRRCGAEISWAELVSDGATRSRNPKWAGITLDLLVLGKLEYLSKGVVPSKRLKS